MIDGFENSVAGEDGRAVLFALGRDEVHLEAAGNSIDHRRIIGFDEDDDIGPLGFDYFSEWIGPAFAAVENVITDQTHG